MSVPYFEDADFKSDIGLRKFRAQIPKKYPAFWAKKYSLSNLNKISPVSYFKCPDFRSNFGFWKLWAQIPKYGHFGPKSINCLILTKFHMYPISNVLISNLTLVFENFELKSLNLSILGQEVLSFWSERNCVCTLFWRSWFQTRHLISVVLTSIVPRLHGSIQCLRFVNYIENVFSLFSEKSQNILA